MLNIWGVAICAGEDLARRRVYSAAALFTLAFAVKETPVFGTAAVFLYLLLNQRRRSALHLLALTAGGYALVLAGIYLGSEGRAFEVFRLTAAGGIGLRSILASPSSMVDAMPRCRRIPILASKICRGKIRPAESFASSKKGVTIYRDHFVRPN